MFKPKNVCISAKTPEKAKAVEAILRFARKVIRQIKLKYLIVAIPEPRVGCLSRKQSEIRLFAVSVRQKPARKAV